jgi:galactose mutarotase-like enzyme
MATLFGQELSRASLKKRTGHLQQVAGIRFSELIEGREAGVRIADVRTGSGLRFQVTLDRGMDISAAEYKGMPLAWRSAAGDVHPSYFIPEGPGWLRTFPGGLLTGCGMTYLGAPCRDVDEDLGLHGRLSHLPAEGVGAAESWEGDECTFSLSGRVREWSPFRENLLLERTYRVSLGESRITIDDRVKNEGTERTPLMMLYHINPGWPLVDEGSRLLLNARSTVPRDAEAAKGAADATRFSPPQPGYREQVFFHDLVADAEGYACVLVLNPRLQAGLYVRYRQRELPRYIEWKMMGEGTYVTGMEPANCSVMGRAAERAAGTLRFLDPGDEQRFSLEIGVLEGLEPIGKFVESHNLR